jgi:hypothetical protein
MDRTAAGMDAETVIPANNPKYALAAAKTTDKRIPSKKALTVISGSDLGVFSITGLSTFILRFES